MKSSPTYTYWYFARNRRPKVSLFVSFTQPADPTKGLGIPRESDLESQWDLIIGLLQDWGKQTSLLEGAVSCALRPREGAVTHRRLDQKYLQVEESPVEACVGRGSPQEVGHWQQQSGKALLGCMPWRLSLTLP